jgi:hypothetical protein
MRSSRARCSRPGKVLLFPPPCGEGGRPLGRSGGGATSGALTWGNPQPRPPLRSADPPRKGEGYFWRRRAIASPKFQRATRSHSRGANGVRVMSIPSHPQSRGRAERRVPDAPLGLMPMRSSAWGNASGLSEARAIAQRSACGVFSVACTLPRGTLRSRIKVPRRWEGSLKRVSRTRFDLVVRHTVQGNFPSQTRPSPCQWQCWRRSVLPEDRRHPQTA